MRSIVLHTSNLDQAPRRIKVVVNRPNLGFADIEDAEEPEVAQVLDLGKDDVRDGKPVGLRFVRFQTVNSLHVSHNHGTSPDPYTIHFPDLCEYKSWRRRDYAYRRF